MRFFRIASYLTIGLASACSDSVSNTVDGGPPPLSMCGAGPSGASAPQLPQVWLDTTFVAPGGKTTQLNANGDLQAAIDAAAPGDTIVLPAGSTFNAPDGGYILRKKTCANPDPRGCVVVIRTSNLDGLPAEGKRLDPAKQSGALAKIVAPNASAAIATAPGAQHYRLIGLEVTIAADATVNYGIVMFGTGRDQQKTLADVPSDLTIDRSWIHAGTKPTQRCLAMNSGATAVIDSYLSECHISGFDAQAIGGWNGPGPFKVVNNYLEGSGENFLLGGADSAAPELLPSDLEFRHNYVVKPLDWKGVWTVKNLFEFKAGQRALIEGNIFENNWKHAQAGFGILFQALTDENTAPWVRVRDITFRCNKIINSAAGVNVLARVAYSTNNTTPVLPTEPASRLAFYNNVFDKIGHELGVVGMGEDPRNGRVFQVLRDHQYVTFDHNTAISPDAYMALSLDNDEAPSNGFIFRNNILSRGQYGVFGSNYSEGSGAINHYLPNSTVDANALVGAPANLYPTGNFFFPLDDSAVGFMDLAQNNLRLSSTSSCKNKGTDGLDLGADINAVEALTLGVTKGN